MTENKGWEKNVSFQKYKNQRKFAKEKNTLKMLTFRLVSNGYTNGIYFYISEPQDIILLNGESIRGIVRITLQTHSEKKKNKIKALIIINKQYKSSSFISNLNIFYTKH